MSAGPEGCCPVQGLLGWRYIDTQPNQRGTRLVIVLTAQLENRPLWKPTESATVGGTREMEGWELANTMLGR